MFKDIKLWEIPLAVFVFSSLFFLKPAHADSGNEAYCKCKSSPTVAECKACCKQDCHDTNWGGDFWGLCTNRCQKNCDLYGGPAPLNATPMDLNMVCVSPEPSAETLAQ